MDLTALSLQFGREKKALCITVRKEVWEDLLPSARLLLDSLFTQDILIGHMDVLIMHY